MKFSANMQPFLALGALLLWCVALLGFRLHRASDGLAIGLLWNLFLATVPLGFGLTFEWAAARKSSWASGVSFFLWLLFLPNAPYLLTDLVHLAPRENVPLWFVLALLLSCGATGALLGYFSLLRVQGVVERKFGAPIGWTMALSALMLCGFGIYLGRFLRWNSWDAFTDPRGLLRSILAQFSDARVHPNPLAITIVFGIGLILGYLALRALTNSSRAA